MLNRLLLTGVISGLVVGVLVTLIHLAVVTPIILEAETYEAKASAASTTSQPQPQAHADEAWAPEDGWERALYTLAANLVTAVGFGLLLASGFTLAGGNVSLGMGALWGLGGYLSFSFLPGLGLPPELPGAAAADLSARQAWWVATAGASVAGIALIAYARGWSWRILGAVLLVAPHVIGAPHAPAGEAGLVPPELAAHFVMATLFMNAVMWIALGVFAAYLFERFGRVVRGSIVDIRA